MIYKSSVRKLGPWAIFEYLINPLLSLAIVPIIINSLGIDIFGEWTLIIASVSLAVSLVSGISLSLSQYISNNYQKNFNQLLAAKLDAIQLALIVATPASLITVLLIYIKNINVMPFLLILIVLVESIDSILSGILRGRLLNKLLAQTELLARGIQFLSILIIIKYTDTLNGIVIGYLVGSILRLIFRLNLNKININIIINHKFSKDSLMLKGAGWGTIQNLGGAMYNSLDKILISYVFGTNTLAVYSMASQIVNQIQAVFSAGLSVQINAVARYNSENNNHVLYENYIRDLKNLVALSTLVYLFFFISSDFIFKTWLGESVASNVIPFILPAVIIAFSQTIAIPGHFMILGLGDIKFAAAVSLIASIISLLFLFFNSHLFSAQYSILSKCLYGIIIFLVISVRISKISRR